MLGLECDPRWYGCALVPVDPDPALNQRGRLDPFYGTVFRLLGRPLGLTDHTEDSD